MTLVDLLPLFAQAGVFGTAAWVAYLLHRDSVRAHQQRADDWRAVAQSAIARAEVRDKQIEAITAALTQKPVGAP